MRAPRRTAVANPSLVNSALRSPREGPRIVFFSGGSALKGVSRALKNYTHRSAHVLTPFDSGGSSARLREQFAMLSIGDLRNRLLALAEEGRPENPAVYALFSRRFPQQEAPRSLSRDLDALIDGRHELMVGVPEPLRDAARAFLGTFRDAAASAFDLRGASLGNLILAGAYFVHERDIHRALVQLKSLLVVRGEVLPVVDRDLHLRATLRDGSVLVGQHRITRTNPDASSAPIATLSLVRSLREPEPVQVRADERVVALIESADLLCFPVGSFFTSVVANLLPAGVGAAIARARCPKVYLPNTFSDHEMRGLSLAGAAEVLLHHIQRDAGPVERSRALDTLLLDEDDASYSAAIDRERVPETVSVVRLPLMSAARPGSYDPRLVAEALVGLTQARGDVALTDASGAL